VNVAFTPDGWEDYLHWQGADRKLLKRINLLLADIMRGDPYEGIGKPEPLRHSVPGAYSRRIDHEHRLVYVIVDAEVVVLQARYHY
jgi:toxin YoeB